MASTVKKEDVASPAAYHAERLQLIVVRLERGKQEAEVYHAQGAFNFYSKTLSEVTATRAYFLKKQASAPSGEGEEGTFRKQVEVAHRFYACYNFECECRQCHRTSPCSCDYAYCSLCHPKGQRALVVAPEKAVGAPKPELSIKVTKEELNNLPLSEAHALYRKYVEDTMEVEGEALKATFWERVFAEAPKRALVRTATPQAQVVMAWRNNLPARLKKIFEVYDEAVIAGVGEALKKDSDKSYEKARREEARLEAQQERKLQEETIEAYRRRVQLASDLSPLDLRSLD